MQRIDRYELISRLPRGGNAGVYVATPEGESEVVVLKILCDGPATERWRRVLQEVRVVRELGDFPGVLPILDDGIHEDRRKRPRAWYPCPKADRADHVLAGAALEEIVTAVASYADSAGRPSSCAPVGERQGSRLGDLPAARPVRDVGRECAPFGRCQVAVDAGADASREEVSVVAPEHGVP
jgi:hypothetical protein